jgi:predicted RNA-binding Zn-ribbon protein involved in translation (DUF1610 family)
MEDMSTQSNRDTWAVPEPRAEMSPPADPPTITAVADGDDDDLVCIACGSPLRDVLKEDVGAVVCPGCGKQYRFEREVGPRRS